MQVAQFYNPDTRKYCDADGKLVIDSLPYMLALFFHIPTKKEVLVKGEEDGEREWNQNMSQCKKRMNEEWLEEERKMSLKEN